MSASPAVALIRFSSPDGDTYLAVRGGEAPALLADVPPGHAAAVLPWDTLPGVRGPAAARLAAYSHPRPVFLLGTTAGGGWATWHLPGPQPPPPERAA